MRRSTIIVVAGLVLSCGASEYEVLVHVPGGPARAHRVEVSVLRSCAELASAADAATDPIRQILAGGAEPLGRLAPGSYGLQGRAWQLGCELYAAGCGPFTVIGGGEGRVEIQLEEILPQGCQRGAVCVEDVCTAPGTGENAIRINFQDPLGPPAGDPLVIDGRTYDKVGWEPFDPETATGWVGGHVGDPSIALYGYDAVGGYSELERSYVYDDWGFEATYEQAVPSGRYQVTIGVGRPLRGYPADPHNVSIEGTTVVDDEVMTDGRPTLVRTATIDVVDAGLSIEIGGVSRTTGTHAYTFLAFLEIVPVEP